MKKFFIFILSAVLASLFWLTIIVSNQNIIEFEKQIPVSLVNLSEDQKIATSLPHLKIKLDAPADVIKALDVSDFKAIIDVQGLDNGQFEREVSVSVQDTNARIVSFSPKNIKFTLEGYGEKSVPVKLELTGNPGDNFDVDSAFIKEKRVRISAANSILEQTNEIIINYELNGEVQGFEKMVKPAIRDEEGNEVEALFKPDVLNLEVSLKQLKIFKTVGLNPVFAGSLPKNRKIEFIKLDPPVISISGDERYLSNVEKLDVGEIDLSKIKLGTKIYTRKVIIPAQISLNDAPKVQVIIKAVEIEN